MVGIELRICLAPRRKQFVAGDDVVAIIVVAVEALMLARLLARLGSLARERRWLCERFQSRRGRKQGRRRAADEKEPSSHPPQQHRTAPDPTPPHHTPPTPSATRLTQHTGTTP